MTYEEAIRILDKKTCFDEMLKTETTADKLKTREDEALKMAIEALEKQISKKPKITIYNAFCPNCDYSFGAEVAMDAIKRPYWHRNCPVCGQTIDWSEEE